MCRSLVFCLLCLSLARLDAATPTVSLSASTTTPAVGTQVIITVQVADAPATTAWQEMIAFDRTRLELVTQAAGSLGTFVADSNSLSILNAAGTVRPGGFVLGTPIQGHGSLAVLTFKVLAGGPATVRVVGKSASETRGTVLVSPAPDRVETVPASGPALVLNPGATISRTITIRAGNPAPLSGVDFTISPAQGGRNDVGDDAVFTGLSPSTGYTIGIIPVPSAVQ